MHIFKKYILKRNVFLFLSAFSFLFLSAGNIEFNSTPTEIALFEPTTIACFGKYSKKNVKAKDEIQGQSNNAQAHVQKLTLEEKTKLDVENQVSVFKKNWVDSILDYSVNYYMPPLEYRWNWSYAVLLKAVSDIALQSSSNQKADLISYTKACVDSTIEKSYATHPNAVASAFALPFLYKHTGDQIYLDKALELYNQYKKIIRAGNGGVSHRTQVVELWDDTVYMIGVFLLEMYKTFNNEEYLNEFIVQLKAHEERLADSSSGLWYHGWAEDRSINDDKCCQLGWNDNPMQRNDEFWGRGNGWIAMALVDCLEAMPLEHKDRQIILSMYEKMMYSLLPLQLSANGHWLQLPIYINELNEGNYIESSCTSMFAYSMAKGIKLGILLSEDFQDSVNKAWEGVRKYSVNPIGEYLTIINVCAGTCIGDKNYYYDRNVVHSIPFALGSVLLFGSVK